MTSRTTPNSAWPTFSTPATIVLPVPPIWLSAIPNSTANTSTCRTLFSANAPITLSGTAWTIGSYQCWARPSAM
jgi:hypothetical protein